MIPADVREQIAALQEAAIARRRAGAENPFAMGERKAIDCVLAILDEHDEQERATKPAKCLHCNRAPCECPAGAPSPVFDLP